MTQQGMPQREVDLHPTIRRSSAFAGSSAFACSIAFTWTAAVAIAALVAIGCGHKRPVVEGSVTLDGVPIAMGGIRIIPADGKGPTAGGEIMAGRYRMETTEGPKKVWINFAQKDGTKVLDPETMGSGRMIDRYVESVPDRYNTKTELEIMIKPGLNTHDFTLEGDLVGKR
jgi:hypothetical protein